MELLNELSINHQVMNLITTGMLVGGFCAIMAWGAASEARRPAVVVIKAGKGRNIADVDLPRLEGQNNE